MFGGLQNFIVGRNTHIECKNNNKQLLELVSICYRDKIKNIFNTLNFFFLNH